MFLLYPVGIYFKRFILFLFTSSSKKWFIFFIFCTDFYFIVYLINAHAHRGADSLSVVLYFIWLFACSPVSKFDFQSKKVNWMRDEQRTRSGKTKDYKNNNGYDNNKIIRNPQRRKEQEKWNERIFV